LVSQFIDSFVVLFIAFYLYPTYISTSNGQAWPFALVLSICFGNYIYKFLMAILLTPFIYLVHFWIDKYLGKSLANEMKQNAIV